MPKGTREVHVMGDEPEQEAPKKKSVRTKGFTEAKARGARKADPRARPASAHKTRDTEVRAAEPAHDMSDEPWVRPATLPHIKARPGFVQRWIRVAQGDKADATNYSRKWREGWRPRAVNTLPKDCVLPTIDHGKFAGYIGVEGSILCEMPVERNAERNAHYQKRKNRQTAAINQQLAEASRHSHPGFGRIQKSEESRAVREVKVAED